jgi:Sulfotransferase domain
VLQLGARIDWHLRKRLPRRTYYFARRRYDDGRKLVRRNPGRGRILPDFIIIGAAKSGTTTLYGALAKHPFVRPCSTSDPHFLKTKEVHYFDYGFYRGEDWYRSHFPLRREADEFARQHGQAFLTGEASPSYISHLWVPERIGKRLPNVKLIAVFRNPVDRAYSQFQMSRKEGVEEVESFEEAVDLEDDRLRPEFERMASNPRYNSWNFGRWSYLARSRYAEQVERWLEHFPREQMLFLKAEDLFTEPQSVLDNVHDFLGLPAHRYDAVTRLNPGAYDDAISPETRARLGDYFRPHNERLRELTGVDFGWDRESVAA